MKTNILKTLFLCALWAVLASGCAITVPPPTQDAIAASKNNDYWGTLGKYIDATYASASDTLNIANPGNGTLRITVTQGDRPASIERLDVSLGEEPGTYYVNVLDAFPGYAALVRFDADGHMEQIDGNLGQHLLTINDAKARYWHAYGLRLSPMTRLSDTYALDDGTTIPISKAPGSALQKLHDSLSGFGLWETKVGQTFVGNVSLLRVDKTQEGHLRLVTLSLEGDEGYHLIFDKAPDHKGSAAKYAPSAATGQIEGVAYDQTELRMRFELGQVDQRWRFFLQGNQILGLTALQNSDDDEPSLSTTVYQPLTQARMLAAMERRAQRSLKAAQDAAYAERRAAEAAAESRATEASIMAGLASGFAQAQQSNYHMNQMSQNFERDLNHKLRQIKNDQDKQRASIKVAAGQISAANEKARRAAPRATLARIPSSRGAQTDSAASDSGQSAQTNASGRPNQETAANTATRQSSAASTASASCRTVDDGVQKWSEFGKSQAEAEQNVRNRAGSGVCLRRGGVVGLSVGQCTEQKNSRTEVDTSVPGKLSLNRVAMPSSWQCTATYRCAQPKRVCDGPARATRQ